jgi:hypothetical protein
VRDRDQPDPARRGTINITRHLRQLRRIGGS